MNEPLTPDERRRVVAAFMKALLPRQPKRHRNMANELNYLATTISRLMLQHFGFRVERDEFTELLRREGYVFYVRRAPTTPSGRGVSVEVDGAAVGCGGLPLFGELPEGQEPFVYVNADGTVVRALRCLTIPAPANSSAEKMRLRQELLSRIERFKQEVRASLPGGQTAP